MTISSSSCRGGGNGVLGARGGVVVVTGSVGLLPSQATANKPTNKAHKIVGNSFIFKRNALLFLWILLKRSPSCEREREHSGSGGVGQKFYVSWRVWLS